MKKVLVTGATGFIGKWTLPLLREKGFEVHAITTKGKPLTDAEIIWHEGDLLTKGTAQKLIKTIKPTHLLHFAWIAEPGIFWTSPLNEDWKRASIELIDAFDGKRAVVAGTCAEYEWNNEECTEDKTPLKPSTLYGQCKRDVHLHLNTKNGISAAWGHIFHLYGPHEHPKRLVPSVILRLLKNERVQCTEGKQIRDFMHVMDVAAAFVALLDSDVIGSVNIASGNPVPVRRVIEMIAKNIGREDQIDWGSIPLSPSEPLSLTGSTRRLHEEVGFSPRFSLQEGLKKTIEWWHTHESSH